MKEKPTIDPAEGWAMLIAPKQVGDIVAVMAELQNPEGRVVASVVTERPEQGGLAAATREASDLLKEMLRLGDNRSQATPTSPSEDRRPRKAQPTPEGAAEFPDPDEVNVPEPSKVTPLNKNEASLEDRPLDASDRKVETAPQMDADDPPTDGDIQGLQDACEAEGVDFVTPETHGQAIDWMVGLREGRYETLPPSPDTEAADEDQDDSAEEGEEAVNG